MACKFMSETLFGWASLHSHLSSPAHRRARQSARQRRPRSRPGQRRPARLRRSARPRLHAVPVQLEQPGLELCEAERAPRRVRGRVARAREAAAARRGPAVRAELAVGAGVEGPADLSGLLLVHGGRAPLRQLHVPPRGRVCAPVCRRGRLAAHALADPHGHARHRRGAVVQREPRQGRTAHAAPLALWRRELRGAHGVGRRLPGAHDGRQETGRGVAARSGAVRGAEDRGRAARRPRDGRGRPRRRAGGAGVRVLRPRARDAVAAAHRQVPHEAARAGCRGAAELEQFEATATCGGWILLMDTGSKFRSLGTRLVALRDEGVALLELLRADKQSGPSSAGARGRRCARAAAGGGGTRRAAGANASRPSGSARRGAAAAPRRRLATSPRSSSIPCGRAPWPREEERREAREAIFALNRKRAEARLRQEKAAEAQKLAAEREAWQRAAPRRRAARARARRRAVCAGSAGARAAAAAAAPRGRAPPGRHRIVRRGPLRAPVAAPAPAAPRANSGAGLPPAPAPTLRGGAVAGTSGATSGAGARLAPARARAPAAGARAAAGRVERIQASVGPRPSGGSASPPLPPPPRRRKPSGARPRRSRAQARRDGGERRPGRIRRSLEDLPPPPPEPGRGGRGSAARGRGRRETRKAAERAAAAPAPAPAAASSSAPPPRADDDAAERIDLT